MRMGFKFSKALIWQLGMWCSLLACVAAAVFLFMSGLSESKDADDTGRRLSIALATGEVTGKINSSSPPTVVKEEPAEETKTQPSSEPGQKPAEAAEPEIPAKDPQTATDTATQTLTPAETSQVATDSAAQAVEPTAAPQTATDTASQTPVPPEAKPEEKIVPGEELPMTAAPEEIIAPDETVTIIPAKIPLPDTNPKLIKKASIGQLPIIGGDGLKSWQYYSRPFERQGKEPIIAIIITGLGHGKFVTEKSFTLPQEITLSFSPYAVNVAEWANTARLTAHEKLVDLPLEPPNFPAADPGPYGLLLDKGLQENENRLRWVLSRYTGYVGAITPYSEVYTANIEAFKVLLQSLANRGLLLVMSHEPAKTEVNELLETTSTPNVIANMLVDEELLDSSIDTRLSVLEQEAKKKGYAVGIIQATPLSIERLRIWSEGLESRGVRLAPLSAVVKLRFS
jgi:polysaccharide deacetylase 2 family uncharacterized protein YibQ